MVTKVAEVSGRVLGNRARKRGATRWSSALLALPLGLAACGANTNPGVGGTGGMGGDGGSVGGSGGAGATGGSAGQGGTGGSAGGSGGSGGTGGVLFGGSGGTGGSAGGCALDTDCPLGSVCAPDGTCVPGCSASQPCDAIGVLTCCGGECVDVQTDVTACGASCVACPQPPNVQVSCLGGICQVGTCEPNFYNCDGDSATGCESPTPCLCVPGELETCYSGPPGTEGVGACTEGTRECNALGTGWLPCLGQVLPDAEQCANGIDDDCDGIADNVPDFDGDGWTVCQGDCCDDPSMGCSEPAKVNPGAFEASNNLVDDDCDGTIDNALALCSSVQKLGAVTAEDMAKAIDLCQFTQPNPPLAQKKWGVVSAEFLLPNGTAPSGTQLANMQNSQTAIMTTFGVSSPQLGATMAGMSSGWMRDAAAGKGAATSFGGNMGGPPGYLAANGGNYPGGQTCEGNCPTGSGAYDAVNLRMSIRVPTNAQSFTYKFRFFSQEFYVYSCTSFNDFYLALLTTGAPGIPADKNISFDQNGKNVSVNNGFFDFCAATQCYTCPLGTGALAGTPFGVGNPPQGGATNWLTTTAPVVPGETMQLELMVFDVSDSTLDSAALIDAFQWSVNASGVGTVEG
jgi:hypothetical protein